MDKVSRAALLSTALAAGTAASATPVTISQQIDLGTLLQQGQAYNGAFDIRDLLVAPDGSPIDIVGARITAFAFSDAAGYTNSYTTSHYAGSETVYYTTAHQGVGYYYYSYRCGFAGWSTCWASTPYYYTYYTQHEATVETTVYDNVTSIVDSVADVAQLTAGGQSVLDTADTVVQTTTASPATFYYQTQMDQDHWRRYLSRNVNNVSTVSGPLEMVLDLGSMALFDLTSDGMISYSLATLVGQARFNWIRLEAFGEIASAEDPGPGEVPEPGALALLGAGALAIGLRGRARDRRKRQA